MLIQNVDPKNKCWSKNVDPEPKNQLSWSNWLTRRIRLLATWNVRKMYRRLAQLIKAFENELFKWIIRREIPRRCARPEMKFPHFHILLCFPFKFVRESKKVRFLTWIASNIWRHFRSSTALWDFVMNYSLKQLILKGFFELSEPPVHFLGC